MTELIVNLTLLLAVLVVAVTLVVGTGRRRRADRRRQNEERSLILQAFVGAAAQPATPQAPPAVALVEAPATPTVAAADGQRPPLDIESVAALLDLLEGRRPARRGLLTGLLNSPRTIWSAGETAGRQAGQRTMAGTRPGDEGDVGAEPYRDAATELVEIHGHHPGDARQQYQRYAAALGDAALAELYVRSGAYNAYPDDPARVADTVQEITQVAGDEEVSDAGAIIGS